MQRIIPFGRDYAQSAEFSVDEGQTVRFWITREDRTTTPGHHAFAELQLKSATGNDHWTTLAELTGDTPFYDLIGVDDSLTYRWVRKDIEPSIAIDRSQDGAYSRQKRAPVDPRQPSFTAPTAVIFKAIAGTRGDLVGLHYDYQHDADVADAEFGNILGTAPNLSTSLVENSYIKVYRDTVADTLEIRLFDSTGNINWAEYEGAELGIASECHNGTMFSTSLNVTAPDISEDGITLTAPTLGLDDTMESLIADGKTFFVFLKSLDHQYPQINLGAFTGRFTLDQNDLPARLTASPFDTADEQVALSAVEGNVVIPLTYNEDGDPIRLVSSFRGYTIVAPGEYQWERSCNSAPGVYLNTGWRA